MESMSMFEKISICRSPDRYLAWPDVALAGDGRLVCVFTECLHHGNRAHSRVMLCDSTDGGRTWSAPRPLTESSDGMPYYHNCPRIMRLPDNRLCVIVDRIPASGERNGGDALAQIILLFSDDHGETWGAPSLTPIHGIVPDKIAVLDTGRWLLSTHHAVEGHLSVFLSYSDDLGAHWSDPVLVARSPELNLCEASLLPLGNGTVVAFMRENSLLGLDCKTMAQPGGRSRTIPCQDAIAPSQVSSRTDA